MLCRPVNSSEARRRPPLLDQPRRRLAALLPISPPPENRRLVYLFIYVINPSLFLTPKIILLLKWQFFCFFFMKTRYSVSVLSVQDGAHRVSAAPGLSFFCMLIYCSVMWSLFCLFIEQILFVIYLIYFSKYLSIYSPFHKTLPKSKLIKCSESS